MPTYEYRCEKCGNHFEKVQSFSANPVKKCPGPKDGVEGAKAKCNGPVKKVYGSVGISFKGSGFYKNDSRSGSSSSSSSSESSSSSSSSDSKTDSKSSDATKSDTKKSDKKKSDTKASKKASSDA
jgi:putative FmdB family regulatory protein